MVMGVVLLFAAKKFKKVSTASDNTKSVEPHTKTNKPVKSSKLSTSQLSASYYSEKTADNIPLVEIIPDTSATWQSRRPLSEMPYLDISGIRKNTVVSKMFPLVVIDIETTGLNRATDKIVEISAIKYENNFLPSSCFTTLINPEKPISLNASKINNITDEMVSSAPKFHEVKQQFEDYIRGCNIAGHNLSFDTEFLFKFGIDFSKNVKYFDTKHIGMSLVPESKIDDYKLDTLCDYFRVHKNTLHYRYYDCYATGQLLEKMVVQIKNR